MSGIERIPVSLTGLDALVVPLVLVRTDHLERLEWLLEQAREALASLAPDSRGTFDELGPVDIEEIRRRCGHLWDAFPAQLLTQDETEEVWDRQLLARALRFTAGEDVPGGVGAEAFDLAERVALVTMADNLEGGR